MTKLIKHKRVEFTELFYDLVFVYAISRTTALIHHLHEGMLSWANFSIFLVSLFVLVNTWMIQTIFTNRYGRNSMFNILVKFANMGFLLFISSMIISQHWQSYFNLFCWSMGSLSLTLFLQYLAQFYHHTSSPKDKTLIQSFLVVTGTRTLTTYLAALFPIGIGYPIFLGGMLLTVLLPVLFRERMSLVPINFPHLIEHLSLLVIITFGEMIMGIVPFFTPESFGLNSLLVFMVIIILFMYYFGQFDHAIDESRDTPGFHLIYSHYLIFIGLIMTTVSFGFLSNSEANHLFVVLFFYAGLFLFQAAVLSNGKYNKTYLHFPKPYYIWQGLAALSALLLSLHWAQNSPLVLFIAVSYLFAIESHFLHFYTQQSKQVGKNLFHWF